MTSEVRIVGSVTLAKAWGTLTRYVIEQGAADERVQHDRDIYEVGDAASVLLYNAVRGTVVLVRQFRLTALLRGDGKDGRIVEACAGMLDGEDPAICAIREAEEETGHRPPAVDHVVTCYLSPGGLNQKVHCFIGAYSAESRISAGGGLATEGEEIEVLEMPFETALGMVGREIIDAQTILLLQHLELSGLMRR